MKSFIVCSRCVDQGIDIWGVLHRHQVVVCCIEFLCLHLAYCAVELQYQLYDLENQATITRQDLCTMLHSLVGHSVYGFEDMFCFHLLPLCLCYR